MSFFKRVRRALVEHRFKHWFVEHHKSMKDLLYVES